MIFSAVDVKFRRFLLYSISRYSLDERHDVWH